MVSCGLERDFKERIRIMGLSHTFTVHADGFDFNVSFTTRKYGIPHLELRTEGASPLSETGYRSHFLPSGRVKTPMQAEAYTKRMLSDAQQTPEWRKSKLALSQYDLFGGA